MTHPASTRPERRRGIGRAAGRQYNYTDITGARPGTLLVVEEVPSANGNTRWSCACECGALVIKEGIYLRAALRSGALVGCSRFCTAARAARAARKGARR